jgi:hypothetical protein
MESKSFLTAHPSPLPTAKKTFFLFLEQKHKKENKTPH